MRLYPWYAAALNAYFWLPVFFLYFLQHMSLSDVLRLEAIYYLAVVVLEVPSGYLSDRFGRRRTLVIANVALLAAHLVFFFGNSFETFAVAQVLLAAGLAANSGTDTSMHFDSLAAAGYAEEFDAREAQVARNALLATGLAGLVGGAVALVELRYAYALSAAAAAVGLGLVLAMREPTDHAQHEPGLHPIRQLVSTAALLRDRTLAWVFGFFVLMTVLNHVPYEFYQPYLDLALMEYGSLGLGLTDKTPVVAGLHVGFVMILASWVARRSIKLRDAIGLGPTLLTACAIQIVVITLMGIGLHPVIVGLMLLRSVPRALMRAPINSVVTPRVDQAHRATFLSLQSLAGRLAFSGWLLVLSVFPALKPTDWPSLSGKLLASAGLGMAGFVLISMTCGCLRAQSRNPD